MTAQQRGEGGTAQGSDLSPCLFAIGERRVQGEEVTKVESGGFQILGLNYTK